MKKLIATVALLLVVPALASAQGTENQYRGQGYGFFGWGTGTPSYIHVHPLILHAGGGGEVFLYKGLGFGAEVGHASWVAGYASAWIASGDFSYHFRRHARRGGVDPFVLGGASFVGPTTGEMGRGSAAGNFGGGANVWLAEHAALRFEFRDVVAGTTRFWTYSHYISWRVGMTFR
jgi:hypothetical protein